jgi:hypothetical protein
MKTAYILICISDGNWDSPKNPNFGFQAEKIKIWIFGFTESNI